jgi:hypothetical protein
LAQGMKHAGLESLSSQPCSLDARRWDGARRGGYGACDWCASHVCFSCQVNGVSQYQYPQPWVGRPVECYLTPSPARRTSFWPRAGNPRLSRIPRNASKGRASHHHQRDCISMLAAGDQTEMVRRWLFTFPHPLFRPMSGAARYRGTSYTPLRTLDRPTSLVCPG